jgi:hypothetical protein
MLGSAHAPMTSWPGAPIVSRRMLALVTWFNRHRDDPSNQTSAGAQLEAIVLRTIGVAYLAVFIADTATTAPHPGLHGRGAVVLVAMIVFVGAAVASQPARGTMSVGRRVGLLATVTVAAAVLAVVQPKGIWEAGPYFVGMMAAMRLDRRTAWLTLAFAMILLLGVSVITGRSGAMPSVLLGAVPWFLLMRVMRTLRDQRDQLVASRAAAAEAGDGWPARCMMCSRTHCPRWLCSSRRPGCSRAVAVPTMT